MGRPGTRNASKACKNTDTISENNLKTPPKEPKKIHLSGDSDAESETKHVDKKVKGDTESKVNEEDDIPKMSENNEEYMVFKMTTGYEIAYNKAAIQDLKDEWGEFILESKSFKTKEEATKYIKTVSPSPPTTPIRSIVDVSSDDSPASREARTALDHAIASLQERKPRNRIIILYKTNSTSHHCVILIQFLNTEGKPQWNVKPDILCDPIIMFPERFNNDPIVADVVQDTVLGESFHHVTHRVIRDLTGGPDTPLTVKWTSPDKTRSVNYDIYLMATWFTIPVHDLNNKDEETAFIEAKLKTFGDTLRKILLSGLFEKLHQANCPKESIWKAINGIGKSGTTGTFKNYIEDSSMEIQVCENLNRYVTKLESDALMNILWTGRKNGSTPKYQK